VTASKGDPLLIGLDRGALEISLPATSFDAVLTPDMRLQPASAGPLDLRIRVVSNGDTCVENRGSAAPALMVSDSFGESSYIVHAQQHVLFEHGSLRQVVDSERSPCGCPPPLAVSVAESGATGPRTARPGEPVAEAHPFPEAVSQGLAPAPAPPQLPPGKTHTQVDLTLTYDSNHPPPAAAHPGEQSPAPDSPVVAQAPTPEPQSPDVVHLVVRFCRWIFRR
jgi:hypothetical protein